MTFIDRLITDLLDGKHERAFPNIDPTKGPFDDMLFSVGADKSYVDGTERWSLSIQRDMMLMLFATPKVEHGIGRGRDYVIPVPKEKKKALLRAYAIAIDTEKRRYDEAVQNLS